ISWDMLDKDGKIQRRFQTLPELVAAATEEDNPVVRGLPADPLDKDVKEGRQALVELRRKHSGQRQALVAARLMTQVAWPADLLRADQIPAERLDQAGLKEPAKRPPELVAVLGDMFGQEVPSVAFSPDGRLLAYPALREIVLWNLETG